MTHYTINGLSYNVEERGAGDPVVLLHGFTGSTETWHSLMSTIAEKYRAIAIDLPGHGQTEAPAEVERYRMECVGNDLSVLLLHLEAAPAHWLGYSMGGRLALYVACRHPTLARSLILESASPGILDLGEKETRIAQDVALAQRIEADGIARFVDYWQSIPLFDTQKSLPEATRSALKAQKLRNTVAGLANSLGGMGTGVQPVLWGELGDLIMPVLLIAGGKDGKFVGINHRMSAAIPNSELRLVPGAGHAVHLEAAYLYGELVMDFFSRLSNGSSR